MLQRRPRRSSSSACCSSRLLLLVVAVVVAFVASAVAEDDASSSASSAFEECPGGDLNNFSPSGRNSDRQSVAFFNDNPKTVSLYWVNTKGTEVFMDEVPFKGQKVFTTFAGHVWRAKA